jgi:hypothetical protein
MCGVLWDQIWMTQWTIFKTGQKDFVWDSILLDGEGQRAATGLKQELIQVGD